MIVSRRFLAILVGVLVISNAANGQDDPWSRMDYGPFISTAVGIGDGYAPVHKGLVVQLRTPDGELTDLWAVFDTDLLAWRCVWRGEMALRGIVYDGPHGVFPEIDGEPLFRLPAVPGVLALGVLAQATDPRDEPWGPVPASLGRWSGLHLDGDDVIFEYTALDGRYRVLERVWAQPQTGGHAFVREITIETTGTTAGPNLNLLAIPPESIDRASLSAFGTYRFREGLAVVNTPGNGTLRLAIAARDGMKPSPPAEPATSVRDAIARARPRWGDSLVTRGILDDPLDTGPVSRQIHHSAGDEEGAINVVAADGGRLELLRDGAAVDAGAAVDLVVLRSLPMSSGQPYEESDEIGWWPSDTGSGTHEQNAFTDEGDLRLDGVTWRRGVVGRSLDFDGTAAAWLDDVQLDLGEHDLTVATWIHTTADGTVFAVSPPEGQWSPDGATLFVRGGVLTFDVGWVGAVSGGPRIDDGAWHHVAVTWRSRRGAVRLFVDGDLVGEGRLPLEGEDTGRFVPRFGWTNENFPEVSRFSGYMDGPIILRRALNGEGIIFLAEKTGEALVEATIVRGDALEDGGSPVLRLAGPPDNRVARFEIPSVANDVTYDIRVWRGPRSLALAWSRDAASDTAVAGRPFRIDRITWPDDNPYGSWLRFGGFEFLPNPLGPSTSVVITTWSGDVWRVDGLDEDLDELHWSRVATGLNQPFGVAVRDGETLVLGRDQITRLVDHNNDGEADFLENITNATRNSEHFHEPASGIIVTPDGGLLYIKAARHAKHALHDHHGTVLQVSPDGTTTEVVARGFRAPFGLTRLPDGSLLGSDQEGHWTPANRINLIRPSASNPPFLGNGYAALEDLGERIPRGGELVQPPWELDSTIVPPITWMHPTVDRSPSSQVFVDHPAWGPLQGSILGLSYGTGEVYLILRDDVPTADGSTVTQGGVVKLGIQLPTGLLTGRIHPTTGDLYVCGLFGWSSDRTEPGGFYRIRPNTEQWADTLNVPHQMRAVSDGLELTFLHPLDRSTATNPDRWDAAAWNYRRTSDYGSADYSLDGRRGARTSWRVREVTLSPDERTVRLRIDDLEPAMQVHVTWSIEDANGRPLDHEAFLSIHDVHR